MSLSTNELARRDDATGRTEFRPDAARLRIALACLESIDGHDVSATFELGVRVAEHRSDRELFSETFLNDRATVTRDEIASHLAKRARDGIASIVGRSTATDVLAPAGRQQVTDAFRAAADAAAFACGLIVNAPIDVELQSASLQRHKLEQMQRQRAEERAAGQVEHLRRAGELLKQFQSIRASADSIAPGDVLQQISPADRGSTLEALLLASSQEAQPATLCAVSGSMLVRIEASSESPKATLIALPETLGPLRSVQRASRTASAGQLLIGARDGVMLVDPSNPHDARAFRAPSAQRESALGFNGAILDESTNTIIATHAERGVVRWALEPSDAAAEATSITGDASSARFPVAVAPGTIAFASDRDVFVARDGATTRIDLEATSPVVGLLVDANRLFVVRQSGRIDVVDRTTYELIEHQQRAGGIVHASVLPWLGSVRLLLARDNGPVECVGPDDQLVTQYSSVRLGYKMISGSADVVAAVSSDRQRLIFWHAWDGRRPFGELHLTAQTRHRIADVEFT